MNPEPTSIAYVIKPGSDSGAPGAQDLTVTKLDGTTEVIRVRPVPLSKIGEYMNRVGDLIPFVELVAIKPAGWADTLTDDSVYAVDALGRELNNSRLSRLLDRQAAAVGNLAPLVTKIETLKSSLQQG